MPGAFDLGDARGYAAWRARKLAARPARTEELIVELGDPCGLTAAEREALLERCARCNMALYAGRAVDAQDKEIVRRLGEQLGLQRLDRNYLADDDGISAITPGAGTHGEFIPYTERALGWHTDGVYNPPERRILAMSLHCVRAAGEGGENVLLDHELAYLRLRDANPDFVRALSAPDAMTIPPRMDGDRVARATQSGPVFTPLDGGARLHMRYTARGTNIVWKDDPVLRQALAALTRILEESHDVLRIALEPGMGIVCDNVLHKRTAFTGTRLLYRARYLDRIAA